MIRISLMLLGATALAAFAPLRPAAAQSATAPSMQSTMRPTPAHSVRFVGEHGRHVTIHSVPASTSATSAPPPAFATLDRDGNGKLDATEAAAYPLLANDFSYADRDRNGSITKSEYAYWLEH